MTLFDDPRFERRKGLFLAGGVICLFLAFALTVLFGGKFAPDTPSDDPAEFVTHETGEGRAGVSDETRWVVYVTGAVMYPGVYEVPVGARANDALRKAGGFSIHAEPEAINLAAKIEDGAHIRIPEKGEARKEEGESAPAAQASPSRNAVAASPEKARPGSGAIDINRASADELQSLPGIGPKLAQSVVDYRRANGPFKSTEDLRNIRGIGAKRFEAVKDLITVTQ